METMHEVVTAKLNNRIRMGQERAMANITKLEYDYGNSRDFISPIGKGHLEKVNFASNGTVKMILNHQDRINIFNLHDNAIRQLSEKLIIPGPYLSTLSNGTTEQKVLAAEILNSHSAWQQSKRFLIRSVGCKFSRNFN